MSVLCLNVCRLCVPNSMNLGVCLKKLHLVKVDVLAWSSIKIRVIFSSRFEKQKVDKKETYAKTETYKLYFRVFGIFLPNVIKIDAYNFELYRFKVYAFFETQCTLYTHANFSSVDFPSSRPYLCIYVEIDRIHFPASCCSKVINHC